MDGSAWPRTDGHATTPVVDNAIWLLLNLFSSWALKLSGEGVNTIS